MPGTDAFTALQAAARIAEQAHAGQLRKYTPRPYTSHTDAVASRIIRLDLRGTEEEHRKLVMGCASWCHDVGEDCHPSWMRTIESSTLLPAGTADLVRELTNPSHLPENKGKLRAIRKAIDRAHLATVSRAAKIIKLADRADNLWDLVAESPSSSEALGFLDLYTRESIALAEVLAGANSVLEAELDAAITAAAHRLDG